MHNITTQFNESGAVVVSLGPSLSRDLLVDGVTTKIVSLEVDPKSPEKASLLLDKFGQVSTLTGLNSGKLSGLLAFKEQVLGSSFSALDTLANRLTTEVNAVQVAGIDAYGNPGIALFKIDVNAVHASSGMQIAFTDPLKISAASQFRVIEAQNNTGGVDASVSYQSEPALGPATLSSVLPNNASEVGSKVLALTANRPFMSLATIPNGLNDLQFYLSKASEGQDIQVFTRDGTQLVGGALSEALKGTLLTTENGFVQGATYSDRYLNQSGNAGYKKLEVFYGAKAEKQEVKEMMDNEPDPVQQDCDCTAVC